ncbi:MAG: hypothetical protein JXB10_17810 [Pirellulales bacterium]|nr:hypothetical protein [Pirellulales bacterium]
MTHFSSSRWLAACEILVIFALFALQGAWPVPDSNEPYYLGKAAHYWNPDWGQGDFFLESAAAHPVFYFTCGWPTRFLPLPAVAWIGRLATWALLAWAWRRLSWSVVPRPGWAVLTAALFALLVDRFPMAGEWIIGGFEAKGLAYVFVLLALESLFRGLWNRAWLWFGLASMFHVLVGGWAALAAGVTWLILKCEKGLGGGGLEAGDRIKRNRHSPLSTPQPPVPSPQPPLWKMLPGLLGGFLLALPGLIPAVLLNRDVDAETIRQADVLHVFTRLPHHLDLLQIKPVFILRFVLLGILFFILCRRVEKEGEGRGIAEHQALIPHPSSLIPFSPPACHLLKTFIQAVFCLMFIGVLINFTSLISRPLTAGLLRFYWYRLADAAVPLGVALTAGAWLAATVKLTTGKFWLAVALVLTGLHFGDYAALRLQPGWPRTDRLPDPEAWCAACDWVRQNTPPTARFFTPRLSQTFTWYTGRPEVVTWKDVPQDARSIVAWWRRLQEVYATGRTEPGFRWRNNLASLGVPRLERLARKYQARYAIVPKTPWIMPPLTEDSAEPSDFTYIPLRLPTVYENRGYVIYKLDE